MNLAIDVEDEGWTALPDLEHDAGAALSAALRAAGVASDDVDVALLFTSDDAIATLNAAWRGKPGPTNVLSFPAEEFPVPAGEAMPLGDIALAYGTVVREAVEQGKTLRDHTMHLIVHGLLHLLGHDHMAPAEADAMEDLERRILSQLGIADPYER
jgi:probable rRNA maturation factor